MGKKILDKPTKINDIHGMGQKVTIQGKVYDIKEKCIRDNLLY